MAGQLVVRRRAAEEARKALFAAKILKHDLQRKLENAENAVSAEQLGTDALTKKLKSKRNKHASLVKKLMQAKKLLDELCEIKEEAEQTFQDAVQAAPKGKSTKKAADNIKRLEKAMHEAQAKFHEQEQLASLLETDVNISEDRLEITTLEHRSGVKSLEKAESRRDKIYSKLGLAESDFETKKDSADDALESVQDILITSETLSTEWGNVNHLAGNRRTPGYLKIRVPQKDIDRDVDVLLKDLAEMSVLNPKRENELRKIIARTGTAAEVGKAAELLGKRRWHDIGLRVIAATWYDSLLSIAGISIDTGTGSISEREKSLDDIRIEFKDTAGLVESIIIHQQDPDVGPLKQFAKKLVDRVIKKRRLDLTDFQRDIIAGQLHAKLLY